jgi:hypothetical protein
MPKDKRILKNSKKYSKKNSKTKKNLESSEVSEMKKILSDSENKPKNTNQGMMNPNAMMGMNQGMMNMGQGMMNMGQGAMDMGQGMMSPDMLQNMPANFNSMSGPEIEPYMVHNISPQQMSNGMDAQMVHSMAPQQNIMPQNLGADQAMFQNNFQGMNQPNVNQHDVDPTMIHHLDPVGTNNQQIGNQPQMFQQFGGKKQNVIGERLYNLRLLNRKFY